MVKLGMLAGTLASGLSATAVLAARAGRLTGARLEGNADKLDFSLLLDEPVEYKVFTLDSPDRVVIDLYATSMVGKLKQGAHDRPPLTAIRYAACEDGRLRVVLEMSQAVRVKHKLQASGSQNILTATIQPASGKLESAPQPAERAPQQPAQDKPAGKSAKPDKSKADKPSGKQSSKGKFIVVVDPGHGGKDPGAIGINGTLEKDVVLEVARKLKARIDQEPGMVAVLTRNADRFVPLRTRMDIAHENNADLFISIHADANPSSRLSGSSVYILSETGASSEAARLLAESENSYDLKFGNHNLSSTSNRIASVLLDLSQNAMMDRSLSLAKGVLSELSKVNDPLRRSVESARFVVLRSPDIPSMLVETAFISNPLEEKRLRTAQYQHELAGAMFKGVKRYQLAYADTGSINT